MHNNLNKDIFNSHFLTRKKTLLSRADAITQIDSLHTRLNTLKIVSDHNRHQQHNKSVIGEGNFNFMEFLFT